MSRARSSTVPTAAIALATTAFCVAIAPLEAPASESSKSLCATMSADSALLNVVYTVAISLRAVLIEVRAVPTAV